MISEKFGGSSYDSRLRRAESLATTHSSATEILTFYREILAFQKTLSSQLQRSPSFSFENGKRGELDASLVLPHFRGMLGLVESKGPATLANAARQFSELPSDAWIALLNAYWEQGGLHDQQVGAFAQFFPRAILQPLAEFAGSKSGVPEVGTAPRFCPVCGARPLLGILRPEGDGAKRMLFCSFCGHQWDFLRILCPTCDEQREEKLPVYVAEEFPHIRIEICDTCKFYTRTIDLTKDGNAVPIVDDLAAIPLTLWAHEHGYSRLQPNLLGT